MIAMQASSHDSPMKFPAVKIAEEFFEFSRRVHVFEVGEQVHVTEWIDGDQGEVRLGLAQMVQWMSETIAIGNEEVDVA